VRGKRGSGKLVDIYRRSDGGWVIKYRLVPTDIPREIRIPREHRTERDARRFAKAWYESYIEHRAKPALVEPPPDKGPTLSEFVDRWIALRRQQLEARVLKPSTVKQDESVWRVHVGPALGDLPVSEMGTAILRQFVRDLASRRAPLTVRNIVSTLTQMIDDMEAEEWIKLPRNPMRHPKVREVVPPAETRAGRNVVPHVPKLDAEKILKSPVVPIERKLAYLLALTSGLCAGEVAGLRWRDVLIDDDIPIARIEEQVALIGYDGPNTFQKPKTVHRAREVPLHPLAVGVLRWWRDMGWERLVCRRPNANDIVLPNGYGKQTRPRLAELLRQDLEALGCSPTYRGVNLTYHALRRTFCTWLEEADVSEPVKRRLMGQSAKGVTDEHYTHKSLARMKTAIDGLSLNVAIEEIIGEGRNGTNGYPDATAPQMTMAEATPSP
jgi:integrase